MHKRPLRRAASALLALVLAAALAVPALAYQGTRPVKADYTNIKVMLDGEYLVLTDVNGTTVEPFAVAGTTYLPVRAVAGALGLNVEWVAETSTVALTSGGQVTTATTDTPADGRKISITVQADYTDIKVTLDGQLLTLTDANGTVVEPFAISGTTYLPVRAISNALGLEVGWDADTSTVVLSSIPFTITAEEAAALIQGNLDEIYLGKYDQAYLDMVGITAEEAEATHLANVLNEAELFSIYWGIVDPDRGESWDTLDTSIRNEIITLVDQIYDHSKFTVAPAVAQADGSYTVAVTISPIDVIQKAAALYDSGTYAPLEDVNNRINQMTEAEYAAAYANVVIDLVQSQMDSLGYLADQTVTVHVTKDANGYFGGDDESWSEIYSLIIPY